MLLADQDRGRWDRDLIAEGHALVRRCLRRNQPAPGGDQRCPQPTRQPRPATDWRRILQLYDQLLSLAPSAVVSLNRAVAVAEVDGPDAALGYEAAIARTENAAEREFLRRRREALTKRERVAP